MPDTEEKVGKVLKEGEIAVPENVLTKIQEQLSDQELKMTELENKNAGLEELLAKAGTAGETKLREKKNFEPKFRTIRVRKYPMAGDVEKMGYIVGWSSRGAYQEVDKTGISPQIVDYIDVIFLGNERSTNGKLQAEKIKLLDFMNKGIQINCKILEQKREEKAVPTGEEINVSVFDPQHGLITTGDIIDGYVTYSDIQYKIQIPGVTEPVWIDALYANA